MLKNRTPKKALEFYKSKMPVHGKTLQEVVKAYNNPAYQSLGPCPSYESQEDQTIKGWYGFPQIGVDKRIKPYNFNGVWGLRCVAAGDTLESYDYNRTWREACGYYMDNFYFRTLYPLVFRLNHNRGFLIGHYEDDNGEVYIKADIYSDEWGAFMAAHSYCARYAEDCREYDAKYQAESQIEDLRAENKQARADIKALIAECRKACESLSDFPAIQASIKGGIKSSLRDLESNRQRIATLEPNYWSAVE